MTNAIELREITLENLDQIIGLKVGPEQTELVADNLYSIAQARLDPSAWCRAAYVNDKPVGFFLIRGQDNGARIYLCRFMIDHGCQGRGLGRKVMMQLLDVLFSSPVVEIVDLAVSRERGGAGDFYQKCGFAATGEPYRGGWRMVLPRSGYNSILGAEIAGNSNPELEQSYPFRIRVLTPADAEIYRAVRLRALQEQPPAFGSLPEDEPDLAEMATRLEKSQDRCFFGAFRSAELIGIVRLFRYTASNETHRAFLASLYVLPVYRRLGCGRALVRQALDEAAKVPSLRRINLTVVTQQEAAIRLYRSLGFHIYGTEIQTFSNAGHFYDEHLMTLELASLKKIEGANMRGLPPEEL